MINSNDTSVRTIKRLVWLYFWLLITEGALRKWVFPQFSTPLLIVRDPVVIMAYIVALGSGVFVLNTYVVTSLILGGACLAVGLAAPFNTPYIALYGWRSNFLHLPFIFLIARVFDLKDVRAIGKWLLIVSVPMAVLMVLQFQAPAGARINTTPGGEGLQIVAAMGKIRPAGTFSFSNGVGSFFAITCAFFTYGALTKGIYKQWLLAAGAVAMLASLAVSGSRGNIVAVGLVFAALLVMLTVGQKIVSRSIRVFVLLGIAAAVLSQAAFFQEGLTVLGTRVEQAGEVEGGLAGFFLRVAREHAQPFEKLSEVPITGHGLGLGTNVGAQMLQARSVFLLAEGEWFRVVLESGPVLGFLYILWRLWLVADLGLRSVRSTRSGDWLPLLLFGASAFGITSGQFGQSTALGFAVLGAGLCLASMNTGDGGEEDIPEEPTRTVRGRSRFAEALHGD